MAPQLENKMLAFSIVNSNLAEIETILKNGLNWSDEPIPSRKWVEEIHLDIRKGSNFPAVGVFYYPCVNNNQLVFVSNLSDVWDSLLYCITKANNSSYLSFRLYSGVEPCLDMMLVDSGETIRLVRSMKEDKWIFDEIGDLLWFEDGKFYSKRKIADRVTSDLLLSYSIKNGINFNSPDFFKTKKESLWVNEMW